MKKTHETPNEGGSYVREETGKLTLTERTGVESASAAEVTKPAPKKRGDK